MRTVILTLRHRPVRYSVYQDRKTFRVAESRYRLVALAIAVRYWLFGSSTVSVVDMTEEAS